MANLTDLVTLLEVEGPGIDRETSTGSSCEKTHVEINLVFMWVKEFV